MNKTNLQMNVERMLREKDLELSDLCKKAKLNEWTVKDILANRLVSVSDQIINKIAGVLDCEAQILFEANDNEEDKDSESLENDNEENIYKKLLPSFANINIDLFCESVAKVDEIIFEESKNISSKEKAKAYLAFYELAINLNS